MKLNRRTYILSLALAGLPGCQKQKSSEGGTATKSTPQIAEIDSVTVSKVDTVNQETPSVTRISGLSATNDSTTVVIRGITRANNGCDTEPTISATDVQVGSSGAEPPQIIVGATSPTRQDGPCSPEIATIPYEAKIVFTKGRLPEKVTLIHSSENEEFKVSLSS